MASVPVRHAVRMLDLLRSWAAEPIAWAVALALVALMLIVPLASVRARHAGTREAVISSALDVGILAALVFVFLFTLGPAGGPGEPARVNLKPFSDLLRNLHDRFSRNIALLGLLGNIALFVPLGVMLALRFPALSAARALLLSAALSFGIEAWQALTPTGRTADITDVLMNTLGGGGAFFAARVLVHAAAAARRPAAAPPDVGRS